MKKVGFVHEQENLSICFSSWLWNVHHLIQDFLRSVLCKIVRDSSTQFVVYRGWKKFLMREKFSSIQRETLKRAVQSFGSWSVIPLGISVNKIYSYCIPFISRAAWNSPLRDAALPNASLVLTVDLSLRVDYSAQSFNTKAYSPAVII